jgi:hypothetical protein
MIKRLLRLLFILIILSGLKLHAQGFKYGLEAGFDVANSHVTGLLSSGRMYYPMISYNINGYLGYKINGLIGVSIEPGFIQKGGLEKGNPDFRVQNNYIQIPLLIDYFINDKFYLSLGPEFAYLINAKAKSTNKTNDITKYYDRRNELSGLIGINYNIYKGFDIGLRYNHGLTYYSKVDLVNENGDKVGEVKEYNQYFQLILRIKI